MIRSITVTNYIGDELKLELTRPEVTGFAVLGIDGLGPVKANINTTEVSTNDGSIFNSSRLQSRNIVIALKYLWKDSIEEARHRTYKYFPIKKKLNLRIETDFRLVEIEGYVESNEMAIFSSDQGSVISIICPNPLFYSVAKDGITETMFNGIEPMFEFPFSNESLVENLLETGSIRVLADNVVTYNGDFEIGIIITIHAIDEAGSITIYNTGTRESMRIDANKIEAITGSGIIAGDDIVISTIQQGKSIKLIRNGISTNILNAMDKNSSWFRLVRGDNVFSYTADFGAANLQFKIEHQTVYEGI